MLNRQYFVLFNSFLTEIFNCHSNSLTIWRLFSTTEYRTLLKAKRATGRRICVSGIHRSLYLQSHLKTTLGMRTGRYTFFLSRWGLPAPEANCQTRPKKHHRALLVLLVTFYTVWVVARKHKQLYTFSIDYSHLHLVQGELLKDAASIQRSVPVECLQWHPMSNILGVGWRNGEIIIYNANSHEVYEQSTVHNKSLVFLIWNLSGSRLITGDKVYTCMYQK